VSGWKAKRFWKTVTPESCEGGFTIRLDGRPVKTPAKAAFVLPSRAMAEACAQEWEAQKGLIKPESMPMTRYANSAIDKVIPQMVEVVTIVAAYGETDLLCYRACDPEGLIARQAAGWDPQIDWAAKELGASLRVVQGITPIAQAPESVAQLRNHTAAMDAFRLAAFHDLVAITGSLILGFAMAKGRLTSEEAFDLSRVDEDWQAEFWGNDAEAARTESVKKADLSAALRFFRYHG
jgi:chaperone required for assembly of F1-ATPase